MLTCTPRSIPHSNPRTVPVHLGISANHTESLTFHLINAPQQPVILGFPWLIKHNPHIDWRTGSILQWSESCHAVCLKSASLPVFNTSSTDEFPDLAGVQSEYYDLKEMFNKVWATSLPPHRSYDCAIDLLSGSSPPRGRLFSVSP